MYSRGKAVSQSLPQPPPFFFEHLLEFFSIFLEYFLDERGICLCKWGCGWKER